MEEKDNVYEEITKAEQEVVLDTDAKVGRAEEGSTALGKFKDVDALVKAYAALEAEFTRRSQKLRQLERVADKFLVADSGNGSGAEKLRKRAEERREAASKFDEFLREGVKNVAASEVNPAEWAYIEAELNNKTAEFVKAKKFDEAIAWLKGYRRVHTHSIKLDGKQKAIEAELVKIGVEDENMKPILDATGTLVGKVEKILNTLDDTTNTVSAADGKTATGGAPDLDAYKSELETYRQALLRCNCTEDEANGIVDKFRKDVDPLLEAISKAAAKGAGKTGEKAPMGTGTSRQRRPRISSHSARPTSRQ